MLQINGRCHCNKISFSATVEPERVMVCHCTDCQRLSGSAFRVVVATLPGSMRLQGEPRLYIKVAASGTPRAQAFCPNCGTQLYSCAAEDPPFFVVRTGVLDQATALAPRQQLWLRSALPWLADLSALPGCQEQQLLGLSAATR